MMLTGVLAVATGGIATCIHCHLQGSREETLKSLDIERARGLAAAVGTDAENMYAVLTARVMNSELFMIARAEGEESQQKLKKAGANRVISPYRIGAMQIAQTALRPAVVDFVEIATSSDNLELSIEEIRIEKGSAIADQPLSAAIQREKANVVVAANIVLNEGDHLIVLGNTANLKELERAAG
jgi:voltage-gated potassium channel